MPTMLLLFSSVLLIVLDQISKAVVAVVLDEGQSIGVWPFRIRRLTNRHFVAGMPLGSGALVAFLTLEIVLIGALVNYGPFPNRTIIALALGAALGGAASNTIDRLRLSGIVDFIDVGFWPVFNVADAAISVGVIASLLLVLA